MDDFFTILLTMASYIGHRFTQFIGELLDVWMLLLMYFLDANQILLRWKKFDAVHLNSLIV